MSLPAEAIQALVDDGTVRLVDAEAAARLLTGAVLNAARWIAAADDAQAVSAVAVEAFRASHGRFGSGRGLTGGP